MAELFIELFSEEIPANLQIDARGVIGVAQRTEYISRIRDLAKGSGQGWLESQK